MNIIKKITLRGLFGIPIGIAIGATIALIINHIIAGNAPDPMYTSLRYFTTSYFVSAVIGVTFAVSSLIWDIERWSLLKQTVIHFLITSIILLICAILAKWIMIKMQEILAFLGIFVVIYIIIFISQYFFERKQVEKVNKELEK